MATSSDKLASIDVAEARRLVGKAIYGDDYIGELSKKDLELLSGPNAPQRKTLANGRAIQIISPCPPNLRNRLNVAIGRAERAFVQYATAIDLLHDNGFRYLSEAYDRQRFAKFLESIGPQPEARTRPVGKPRDLIEGVKLKIESDVRGGIDISALKGKEMAAKYGCSRNTAMAARKEVLEEITRK